MTTRGVFETVQNIANRGALLFANLPTLSQIPHLPAGSTSYTLDQGLVVWTGAVWIPASVPVIVPVPGVANVQQVMASPPTVAISTTNPLAGQQQYVASGASHINNANWTITGAANPVQSGASSPDNGLTSFNSVQQNNNTSLNQNGSNLVRVSVTHTGTELAIVLKGLTGSITAKVNDQYVSLTPTAVPNNGSLNYYSLTFGASGTRRIDFIIDNVLNSFHFGGFWAGLTDTLQPADIRGGKRIIVMGDSITSATGAPNQSAGYVQCFAEYMGYDDVWPSGVGGTGLTNSGSSVIYQARVQQDIIAFNPTEVIIAGFQNDTGATYSQIYNALYTLISTILAALPNCKIWVFGPYTPFGAGYASGTTTGTGYVAIRGALNAVVGAFGSPAINLLDPSTLPFNSTSTFSATPVQYNLTSAATTGATTLPVSSGLHAGVHYQFLDGSRFRCLSSTGTTATIDKLVNSQASGATFTQCGASWITGDGFSGATTGVGNADNYITTDHIHPVALGHLNLGLTLGRLYELANNINS